jgi:ribosomal protein S18 acetylase RimI-like enzyme
MLASLEPQQLHAAACDAAGPVGDAQHARLLVGGHEAEVLDFLSARPLHTVYMAGFIRDNGLVSPLNRGAFYGCRDAAGRLAGVALVGHVTQVEARAPEALRALARAALDCSTAHVIMGEQRRIRSFWRHYAGAGQPFRLACRELLLVQSSPAGERDTADGGAESLRPATAADLPLVMPAQAAMAVEECGVNPLEVDPEGFRARCARRVARGRVWVAVGAGGRLDFKADVMAETPEAVYLEGVYVRPGARGRGIGRRCMTQLGRELLARSRAVCLLVNEGNLEAQSFYRKIGFSLRGLYETIYLHKTDA